MQWTFEKLSRINRGRTWPNTVFTQNSGLAIGSKADFKYGAETCLEIRKYVVQI
jgi:hypothetical protein